MVEDFVGGEEGAERMRVDIPTADAEGCVGAEGVEVGETGETTATMKI